VTGVVEAASAGVSSVGSEAKKRNSTFWCSPCFCSPFLLSDHFPFRAIRPSIRRRSLSLRSIEQRGRVSMPKRGRRCLTQQKKERGSQRVKES
jgi:hypothetical protein